MQKFYKIIIFFACLLFITCGKKEVSQISSTEYIELSSDDNKLNVKERVMYYNSLLFTGKIKETDGSGKKLMITEYKDGKKNGLQFSYYSNGQVNEERYFENGKMEGEHKGWWASGRQRFISNFKNDVFEGNVKMWNESGMLFSDFNYVNGNEDGLQRAWFADGTPQANYVAKNFRKYGLTGVKNCKSYTNEIQN